MSSFSKNTELSKTNEKEEKQSIYGAEKQYYEYLRDMKKGNCQDDCNYSTAFIAF